MTTQRARTRVRLCGALGLEVDGRELAGTLPEGQPAVLLAALLVERERGLERDALAEILWPRQRPRDPGSALRPVLSRLRRAIEPVSIEGRDRVRVVLPEPVWVDLDAAAADLAAARGRDPIAAAEHADAAIRALGDGVLPELDGAWLAAPRALHEDLLLEALEIRARAALALGEPELVAAERAGREIVSRSPYRESGHRALMEALAAQGNVAEALRVYDELRVLLRDELGTAPAPAVQALHYERVAEGEADGWLLPGRKPGTHITAEHLRKRLAPYGVTSRPGRHGALLALAGRLPAPILAERLGIHQSRAAQWARAAGATYAPYVQLRPERTAHHG